MTLPVVSALVVVGLILFYAYRRLVDTFFRQRGKRIERRSISRVRVPKKWEVRPNVPIPGRGDCDLYIKAPSGRSWAIEIKSYEGAKKVLFSMFSKHELVKANGQRFERDPVAQVLAEAQALGAEPVLWMPKARHTKTFRSRSGVLVVQGGPRRLERAIGARGWFFLTNQRKS